uniref:Coiled-coil domain containing 183 n=1 Tax=Terrapene triunguis TaxID=2587831 RepID=A0A674IFT8_9SAUR
RERRGALWAQACATEFQAFVGLEHQTLLLSLWGRASSVVCALAAREKLQNYIFDKMNVHNVLLYEVKRRGGMLEGLQRNEATQDPSLLQVIRQLENNIEKMLMKIRTGEKIYYLYLKMVDFLKDELAQLPLQLDVLQHMVEVYQVELKGMRLMAVDATKATEEAKTDMTNMETEFIAERRFRENSLNFQKKQIDRIRVKDASERHRRVVSPRELWVQKGKLEASKAQIEHQAQVTSEVDKIKCAVQCSHLWDIAGRFLAQQKTGENLQQQIVECGQKREELETKLKELELERAELKFHQTPSSIRYIFTPKNLEAEEVRLHQVHTQMLKNQELLLSFENGVDNLLIRLCGITVPGHVCALNPLPPALPVTVRSWAGQERALCSYLFSIMFLLNETPVPRAFPTCFTRLCSFADAFDFADIDHSYVPNRDEIKKQGVRLIETMTKAAKKKQRGGRKGA